MSYKIAFAPLLLAASFAFAAEPALLNDAQIAHIAYTAGKIDIDAASLALTKSTAEDVRAFAETMLRDHSAVNERALALLNKLGVTPEDNATSAALTRAASDAEKLQQPLSEGAFDRAYVSNEVAFHAQVNAVLRDTLITSAANPELKELLQDGLALFSQHQQHAEMLQAELTKP